MSAAERNTLRVLLLALALWFAPGIIGLIAGDTSKTYEDWSDRLDEGVVAILAAALLFVLPLDWRRRRFTLNWTEAVQIDWGTIMLFGGGIALGTLMEETGLAKVMGEGLADALGVSSTISITILAVVIAVLISEAMSNTASATIVVPIVMSIAVAADVNPVIPALGAIFGANYGFMLPVDASERDVYASGMIPITRMVRTGIVVDVIGAVLSVLGVALMAKVVGLA